MKDVYIITISNIYTTCTCTLQHVIYNLRITSSRNSSTIVGIAHVNRISTTVIHRILAKVYIIAVIAIQSITNSISKTRYIVTSNCSAICIIHTNSIIVGVYEVIINDINVFRKWSTTGSVKRNSVVVTRKGTVRNGNIIGVITRWPSRSCRSWSRYYSRGRRCSRSITQ